MLPFVVVLLVAELPDLGQLSFASYCAAFGAAAMGFCGYVRRGSWEGVGPLMGAGTAIGYAVGFVVWLVVLTTDRL